MDYSYFNSAPQPYHYFGMVPTSGAAQPMDMDTFVHGQQAHYNPSFPPFQESFQYDPTPYIQPTTQSSQPSRAPSRPMTNPPSRSPAVPSFDNVPMSAIDAPQDDIFPRRSSSEENDNLTHQQSKRKAQNRAAQRAFRERKEKHLKDLEMKLNTLDSENERLRKKLKKSEDENKILRASSTSQSGLIDEGEELGSLTFTSASPKYDSTREGEAKKAQVLGNIHTIVIDDSSGELLLNSRQAWDYIQANQSFREGLIEVGDAMDRLKKMARCDGQAPVFRESDIRKAIEESAVAGGRDELL